MAVTFGWVPSDFVVSLSRGGDFTFTLQSQVAGVPAPWPAGIGIELRFSTTAPDEAPSPIVWPAAISGADATWDVPAVTVATVLTANATHVRLRYIEADGSVLIWLKGTVHAS